MSKRSSRGCFSTAADALGRLSSYITQSDSHTGEPSNEAAYLEAPKTRPLVVRSAPYVLPRKGQVLIKNAAVAVNPIDWKVQDYDVFQSTYPLVLGSDAAGEVVAVGEGVTEFSVGQRVLADIEGAGAEDNAQGGFQKYSIARSTVTTAIPNSLPFEHAVVLGLGIATAAAGLYQKEFLALKLPSPSKTVKPTKEVVLVWGGSSSVGSCAIQLARNSGYDVFAVAGSANLDYMTELGAVEAFNYRDENVVHEILAALKDRKLAGSYDAIGSPTTITTLAQIVSQSDGCKFIAHTSPGVKVPNLPHGVTINGVNASTVAGNEVGPAVFNDFLPKALKEGQFLAKPDPLVIGHGLEYVQKGLDMLKGGVSATKVVISL